MPLTEEKKTETRERLERDPDFREEFLMNARNMYIKALVYQPDLADEIDRFELILGSDPGTYEYGEEEGDEIEIFERILNAYDTQLLIEEKSSSTIN